MTPGDIKDLLLLALWTIGIVSAPALLAAMVTGVVIALLQAVTQVQEVTLTFVPKIIAVLLALLASSVMIGSSIEFLAEQCYQRIAEPARQ